MIKGFSLFFKNFGLYFFVANSVNIHKKSLLGSLLEKMGPEGFEPTTKGL